MTDEARSYELDPAGGRTRHLANTDDYEFLVDVMSGSASKPALDSFASVVTPRSKKTARRGSPWCTLAPGLYGSHGF